MLGAMCPRITFVGVLVVCLGAVPVVQSQDPLVEVVRVFPNLTFESPIGLTYADDDANLLYVPEFAGRVRVFENDPAVDTAYVFLDLSEEVSGDGGGEFYDVAFHPEYEENGHVYVYYFTTSPRRLLLVRYTRDPADSMRADPASRSVLLDLNSPGPQNHHGGKMAFGPDGYLYLPIGDGGSYSDVLGHGQDRSTLLGSVVRLDVDQPAGGLNYGIPPDNPFAGNTEGWREEIWAYGFRNPYSASFDRLTGAYWLGDVGEVSWEEINVVEGGKNYGWAAMEGPDCFEAEECEPELYAPPIYAYPHVGGSPSSVIGGTVYRGRAIPEFDGLYVFGDFFSRLWAADFADPLNPVVTLLAESFNLVAFGQDREGELYLPRFFVGHMTKIVPVDDTAVEASGESGALSLSVYPNPFRSHITVDVVVRKHGPVRVALYDVLGREVARVFEGTAFPSQLRRIQFDAARLASGTYVMRIEGGGEVQTQRLSHIQ